MKLKIMALAIAFVLLVPGVNALAAPALIAPKSAEFLTSSGTNYSTAPSTFFNTGANGVITMQYGRSAAFLDIELDGSYDISQYYFQVSANATDYTVLYYSDSNLQGFISSHYFNGTNKTWQSTNVKGVKSIRVRYYNSNIASLFGDFMLMGEKAVQPPAGEVDRLSATATENDVKLSWVNPTSPNLKHINIYKDGVKLTQTAGTSYTDKNVVPGKRYTYKLASVTNEDVESPGTPVSVTVPFPQPVAEVSNYKAVAEFDGVDLSWTNPTDSKFKHVIIYKNGVKLKETTDTSFRDTDVEIGKQYAYKITSYSTQNMESEGATRSVLIPAPKPVGEIEELTAKAKHDRVDLSWQLPESNKFKHVNIYRDELRDMAMIDKILGVKSVSAAATTKIFETNGTYFNDLTVKPETTYEYTLTTLSTEGAESNGLTEIVVTPEEPAPEIIGGDFFTDPVSGDFIYTWKKPTTGQVKVKIDGKEYKTVDAADGKIVVPKDEMKYTKLGDPLISLTPIGTNGKSGEEVKVPGTFDNISMPFTVREMMMAALALFGLVGGITLLFLAFKFVPKWLALLKSSNRNGRTTAIVAEGNGRRFQDGNSMEASAAAVKTPRELKVAAEKAERTPKAPRIPRTPKEPRVRQREPRVSQREPRRRRGE